MNTFGKTKEVLMNWRHVVLECFLVLDESLSIGKVNKLCTPGQRKSLH